MKIIAFDCGTKTGWACYENGRIESGVMDFTLRRGESRGIMYLRFGRWLKEVVPFDVDVIAYEQAHHRGGAAVDILVNLTGRIVEFAAIDNLRRTQHNSGLKPKGAPDYPELQVLPVHTATIKKFATGSGRAGKEEMIEYFHGHTGRMPVDDNEADAYALLRFVMADLGVEY